MDHMNNHPKRRRLVKKFSVINMWFLIIILFLMAIVVTFIINDITDEASRNYARLYSVETVERFSSAINTDIVLLHKVSSSKALKAWLADENNLWRKIDAYGEIEDYARIIDDALFYCVVGESSNEYKIDDGGAFSEFMPFDSTTSSSPDDQWYYEFAASDYDYEMNVDIDKATGVQRLWINHKVMDDDRLLGVFCSAISFDKVFKGILSHNDLNNVRGFIVDREGVIHIDSYLAAEPDSLRMPSEVGYKNEYLNHIGTISPDPAIIEAIGSYPVEDNKYFNYSGEPRVIRLKGSDYSYASIAPINGTTWLAITFFNDDTLFSASRILPLIIAMVSAFVIYTAAGGAIIRRLVLNPLNKLTDSVSAAGTDNGQIYGGNRDDEFGELANTIQAMCARLNTYNEEILNASEQRDRQRRLLHAVNETATVLLASDKDKFESSLLAGMELMAGCMDVDRVYIWQTEMIDGKLRYKQQFEWLRNERHQATALRTNTGCAYMDSTPQWEDKFLHGECVNGPVASLSEEEQSYLKPYDIKSVLLIPVYLQEKFWGFVSFDDCHRERYFDSDEISILRSGSLMLASAVKRNETDALVRTADDRTRLMLDATPLCCNLWDKDLNNIECNAEAVKLFDLESKQEYMERFFELSPEYQPDGRLSSERSAGFIKEAFETGRVQFEWMHKKLDGTPVTSEITLVRVEYEGEYIVAGYTRDLREYKQMMREIEYRDALLQTINDAVTILLQAETDEFSGNLWRCMGMMACGIDVDRVYIWKNHVKNGELRCTQICEWSEGAEPQQDTDYTIDISYKDVAPSWEGILSSGRCINGIVRDFSPAEREHLSSQGVRSILVEPVFLQDRFWGFVGFDDCKTERIFSESEESILRSGSMLIANALLRNEMTQSIEAAAAKMEAVISNYTGIIFSVDRDNIITIFNGLYLKTAGLVPEDFEGKTTEEAWGRKYHSDIIENVDLTFIEGPQDWISEIGGRLFRAHTTPIYDNYGVVVSVVGSLDDITDTIRLQKELEKALCEARSASRAKSDFLSNMSHEMRTPMNAIIGMTMIGKSANDIEKKDYAFGKIEGASSHLLGVINDILDMSKIESGKFELSEVEFSFEKLLQKVTNVISFRMDEKRQRFAVYLDKNIPRNLIGDDQRLAQLITNLLSNAVKFTPEQGSIHLNSRLLKEENGICEILVEVTDTGIGISKEQQARLFNSFEQAESSTSRKYGGTGLGLVISKHIVELMGGSIWIESELGQGSTFAFKIKLAQGERDTSSLLSPGVNWSNIRVLVVDDDPEALDYFSGIAEQLNISCEIARTGDDAIWRINTSGPYDIYFIDWNMPGIDGIELSRRIKEISVDERSVIIMISGVEWNIIEREARASGVNKFLPKPLFPSAIADCINQCIGVGENLIHQEEKDIPEDIDCFEGYYLLLAEDIEINREIVLAILEPTGIKIDCAENGREAVRLFSESPERYDMIFMDVQMPEMDGLEATRHIREMDIVRAKEIPIVAMTANVFKEDVEKCLAAGMNNHIGKPLDFNEVFDKIKESINARQPF